MHANIYGLFNWINKHALKSKTICYSFWLSLFTSVNIIKGPMILNYDSCLFIKRPKSRTASTCSSMSSPLVRRMWPQHICQRGVSVIPLFSTSQLFTPCLTLFFPPPHLSVHRRSNSQRRIRKVRIRSEWIGGVGRSRWHLTCTSLTGVQEFLYP